MKSKISELKNFGKNFKILYVEDNNNVRDQTDKMLSNFFTDVTLAIDGRDGLNKYLDYYKKHEKFYDLVITDINMPIMNGLEMSEEILKKHSTQVIVITTAHNETDFLTQAISIGISGFITKPIKNIQFLSTLHKVSLAISDRKFVEEHIRQMEEITIELEEHCKEISDKNRELERSLRVLNTMTHKEQMSHLKKELKTEDEKNKESYVKEQINYLIHDDLHELVELHSEIDNQIIEILNNIINIDNNNINNLINKFSKYASILAQYSFFTELSVEMSKFTNILKNETLPNDIETVTNIFMLLESFIFVLGKWHSDLASGDESKINALDASITSDMKTITNMWSQEEEDLQDIFDF